MKIKIVAPKWYGAIKGKSGRIKSKNKNLVYQNINEKLKNDEILNRNERRSIKRLIANNPNLK